MADDAGNLEQLINRQVRLWDLRQQLAREGGVAARRELAHLGQGPWITLSRQIGSGGSELGHMLGQKLGWQVFDKQILTAIARNDPAREKLLSRLDEHAVGALEDYLNHLFVRDSVSQYDYVREVIRMIWTVARQGHAIFMGRGANWILDPRYGLRLRVVAPLEQRVVRVAEKEGLPSHAARRRIMEGDQEVAAFIRQVYHRNLDDPLGYDLILNLDGIDPGTAVDTVITALHRKLEGSL